MFVRWNLKFGHFLTPAILKKITFYFAFEEIKESGWSLLHAQVTHCKIHISFSGNTSSLLMLSVILGRFILCNTKPICSCFSGSLIFPKDPANCSPNVPCAIACPISGWQLNYFFSSAGPLGNAKDHVSCRIRGRTSWTKTLLGSLANVYQHGLRLCLTIIWCKEALAFRSWLRGQGGMQGSSCFSLC